MASSDSLPANATLPLFGELTPAPPPSYATYEWTQDGLREAAGADAILYRYWDRGFGCALLRHGYPPIDVVIDWPILASPTFATEPEQLSVLAHVPQSLGAHVNPGPRSELAFMDYIASLPTSLVRLAAPFGKCQWLMLDLLRRAPGLWRVLATLAARGQYGVLSLYLSRFQSALQRGPDARQDLAEDLAQFDRSRLVGDLIPCALPVETVAALDRISPGRGCLPATDLRRLQEAEHHSKVDRIAESATVRSIASLFRTPPLTDFPNLSGLTGDRMPAVRLAHTVETGLQNLSSAQEPAARKSLLNVQSLQALQWWVKSTRDLALNSLPFPAPPLAARPPLEALCTAGDLREASQHVGYDLSQFLPQILSGELFFFSWKTGEPAVVVLASTQRGDWVFLEAFGKSGCSIPADLRDELFTHLMQ